MEIDPPEFHSAPLDTFVAHALTPRPDDPRFRGLVIVAPRRVGHAAGERPVLPVCGFARQNEKPDPGFDPVTLVVVDPSGEEHRGLVAAILPGSEEIEPNPVAPPPEVMSRLVKNTYFNPDALGTTGAPVLPGAYRVRAERRGMASDEVVVELVEVADEG